MRSALVASVLLVCAPLGAVRGQTLDEVRKTVDDYFADDAAAEASHASLENWGNAALPALRELAGKPEDVGLIEGLSPVRRSGWDLVCSIGQIGTAEAAELLIEILDGKTAVAPEQAIDKLWMMCNTVDALRSNLRFQQLVFKFAKSDAGWSSHSRGVAARIIAACGWEDGAPLLELMLQDEDLTLREHASAALAKLTGKQADVRRPALEFPHAAQREDLVLIGHMSNRSLRGRLDTWFDGQAAHIRGSDANLEAGGRDGPARESVDAGFNVADFLSLPRPDGTLRWVFLADEEDAPWRPDPSFAVCVDRERRELWRYTPPKAGIEAMCRLYDTTGCIGVAFGPGSEEGVVAFDGDGQELFRVPRTYVTYELASHPRLPGVWLHCGGDLELRDNQGQMAGAARSARWQRHPSGGFLYARHAVLVADAAGEAVIIAAGAGANSVETIVRCDTELHEAWRATIPTGVEALALLDSPGREPLLAATTEAGELLVFDLDGGLHQRLALLPEMLRYGDGRVATYSISAGPLPGGGYGLAVGLLSNTLLYELR